MDKCQNLEVLNNIKNLALLKLGRNFYNFSLVEQWLKYLVTVSNITMIDENLDGVSIKKSNKVQKMMLGQLIGDILQSWHPENQNENVDYQSEKNLKNIRISTNFRIELDMAGYSSFKQSCEELIKDRNDLTHHFAKQYPLTSEENCNLAINYLDNMREKHLTAMNQLHEIVKTHVEFVAELKEYIQSSEFLDLLNDQQNGTTIR